MDFHGEQTHTIIGVGQDVQGAWVIARRLCPGCKQFVLYLEVGKAGTIHPQLQVPLNLAVVEKSLLVWPKGVSRAPIPTEVPPEIAEDYKEACSVLADSPKASAALSRRCLQLLLRTAAGVKHGDLSSEIQQVLDSRALPTSVAENVDAIRNIGNFAAHPNKSTITGEVLPVEPDEAEWTLDVLELLFDFYYVQPARAKAKRDALNKKLQDAKKPPMK